MIAKTKSGLPKHYCHVIDRHGKHRVRFRRGHVTAYITGIPWSEDFMRQYGAALDRVNTPNIGVERTKPVTVNALIVAYYKSPDFKNLSDSTRDHPRQPRQDKWHRCR